MPHYAQFCPIILSSLLPDVPAAVANEKYLSHSDSPSSYAVIRREMLRYADLARDVSELSESVKVA